MGIWDPSGTSTNPLIVAMDAYRRAGLKTRFSMFMPLALLSKAEETGYEQHESETGEILVAFRASRTAEYITQLIKSRSAGLNWSEKDFGKLPSGTQTSFLANTTPAPTPTQRAAPAVQSPLFVEEKVPATAADAGLHIRPKVGMYAAFARLNYKPWFAIAEFVDNSVQSYLTNRNHLPAGPLEVDIRFDEDEIVITDRAGGIAAHELGRAFSPSQPPPDASGLSEFGLGMKAAACWFARYWTVRTCAYGEGAVRLIRFDVDKITSKGIEHIPIESQVAPEKDHYTVVTLRNLRVHPKGRTLHKVKDHLASIYRVLAEKGLVQIKVTSPSGSEILKHDRPQLLTAPYYREPNEEPRIWRSEFKLRLPGGRTVSGWAGLLAKASGSRAGLSVFRRDRLIQGSGDETYRPERIFRQPNSYTYQRVVGELFVDGFEVSHTKDGIEWAGLEDEMLSKLHKELNSMKMPILAQAEGYRVRQQARELPDSFGAEALHGAAAELETQTVGELLAPLPEEMPPTPADPVLDGTKSAVPASRVHQRFEISLVDNDEQFVISLELVRDPAREWYGFTLTRAASGHRLEVWINLSHPFSESYVNGDENTLGPLVRLVAAMVLAEHTAVQAGVKRAAGIRQRVNELLRDRFGDSANGGKDNGL